jgi:hypothetical protein
MLSKFGIDFDIRVWKVMAEGGDLARGFIFFIIILWKL